MRHGNPLPSGRGECQTATALGQEYSLTSLVAGATLAPDKGLKRLVADIEGIRKSFEAEPLQLPVTQETLAARVRASASATRATPTDLAA